MAACKVDFKESKVQSLPSCPEFWRCSIRSQPNAFSLPFFLDFCLVPLFFMWLQLVVQMFKTSNILGSTVINPHDLEKKVEFVDRKADTQKSQQSTPKRLHPLTF